MNIHGLGREEVWAIFKNSHLPEECVVFMPGIESYNIASTAANGSVRVMQGAAIHHAHLAHGITSYGARLKSAVVASAEFSISSVTVTLRGTFPEPP